MNIWVEYKWIDANAKIQHDFCRCLKSIEVPFETVGFDVHEIVKEFVVKSFSMCSVRVVVSENIVIR